MVPTSTTTSKKDMTAPEVMTGVMDFDAQFIAHLSDPESLQLFIREGISTALLVGNRPQAIWNFTRQYFEESKQAPPLEVLVAEFPSFRFVEEPRTAAHWVVDKLRDRYRRGQVQEINRTVAELGKDPDAALSYMRERVFEVETLSGSSRHTIDSSHFDRLLDQYQEHVIEGMFAGRSFGFDFLDAHTGGQKPGHLSFLVARPKRFKTFFLLESFVAQVRAGGNPIFFTLELTLEEAWQRLTCIYSGFPFTKIVTGDMSKSDYDEFRFIQNQLQETGKFILSRPPVGERTVSALFGEVEKREADSILIDQLSFLEPPKDYYARPDLATADIVYALKNAASRRGSERPVYVAAQINRQGKDEIDATTIALSDSVGQAADLIVGLTRTKAQMQSGLVFMEIVEARHCEPEEWQLSVTLKTKTCFELSREY